MLHSVKNYLFPRPAGKSEIKYLRVCARGCHIVTGEGLLLCLALFFITSCARMGHPDGGWFDETPPRVLSASPSDRGTNNKNKKVIINFDEYIKLENASEKVVVSPPQHEQPEIKAAGKRIIVELKDTLKENTTYTIDFSDAITDNNEGNPLGNYTYSFSTGDQIDTLEVSGTVLTADNLEPVKGTLVGLYRLTESQLDGIANGMSVNAFDSIIFKEPFIRVARTDSRGRFIIRGIAPGSYRVVALNDMDDNFMYSQAAEGFAYNYDLIVPSCAPDIRQDTIWADTIHIRDIKQVPYTHFRPDNIVLRQFVKEQTDRFFLKIERKEANMFQMFFSGPSEMMPQIKGLNFDETSAFVVEYTPKLDTITYWIKDSALIDNDTLRMDLTYETTDSLGHLVLQTDSALEILSKQPYEKRMKQLKKEMEDWEKKIAKKRKRGEEVKDTLFPVKPLEPKYDINQRMAPDQSIYITMPTPIQKIDTAAIHLYIKQDDKWYNDRFVLRQRQSENATPRDLELIAEWKDGAEYSFEIDTLAFEDIYGKKSKPYKAGIRVSTEDDFSSLFVKPHYPGADTLDIIVQMLDRSEKVIKQALTVDGIAEFYYVKPGEYYLRAFIDNNGNGKWDTGNFEEDLQPEEVYYYHEKVTCREKWDVTRDWNLLARPLDKQKPVEITKQKADKEKTIKQRNAERAREKGIRPPEYY